MSQKEEPINKDCCGGGCAGCPRKGDGKGDCDNCGGCAEGACNRGEGGCGAAGRGCASGCGGCGEIRSKLHSFNYFEDIPGGYADDDMVEVQFKNTRKGYYLNSTGIPLEIGDMVAVEASPGHDIGQVSLTGALVRLQMRKANIKPDAEKLRVFRKAKASDLERYEKAKALENDTMIRARKIASSLQLNMKIGDVEYQGDGNKAIFYYIADERVDFRQLIKVLAETFKVRIEMKQIGARQEAGRIGGTGPCGRELCCATWIKNFVSVSTNSARFQDISLNPQKLAGMCAKLKCCLNYEVDNYVEASRRLPSKEVVLQTLDSDYYLFKTDILAGTVTYSTDKNMAANLETISAARARQIIEMNRRGEKPESLQEDGKKNDQSRTVDLLANENISRFDKAKKKKKPNAKGQRQGMMANGDRQQQPKQGGGKGKQQDDRQQENKQPENRQQPENRRQTQNEERAERGERRQRQPRNNRRPNPNRPQKTNQQQQDAKE